MYNSICVWFLYNIIMNDQLYYLSPVAQTLLCQMLQPDQKGNEKNLMVAGNMLGVLPMFSIH